MTASDLISEVPALSLDSSIERALQWMDEFHVRHLPVVQEKTLIGIVSEHQLFDAEGEFEHIEDIALADRFAFVKSDKHLYDVMQLMADNNLTTLPVLHAAEGYYMGLITLETLFKHFSVTGAVSHSGAILVLEMPARNFVLSEIARLLESENTLILSAYVSSPPNSETLELTLKLNRLDLGRAVATLERFGYVVKNVFDETDYTDTLRDRYDLLMNYLNM